MFDPVSKLVAFEVKLAEWIRKLSPDILDAPPDESSHDLPYSDYGYKWSAYTLAHLYTAEHPDNFLQGETWCAELAMQLVDKSVEAWYYTRKQGKAISTGETPHYVTPYVLEQLGDLIDNERRERWLAFEEEWISQALTRAQGYTACYHDSWRMTGLYRMGRVLKRPELQDTGVFLFRQMLAMQTDEGFWEDGRHHGPSMRYCGLMLPSLAWMYRWTEDEAFGDAARKLVDFMATYIYPDGYTVGIFDGRNANVPGYFPTCPGFELTEKGRVYTNRIFKLWDEMGMFEDPLRSAQTTRDLARMTFYTADTCNYLMQYAPDPESVIDTKGFLPIDRDGVIENHTAEFDGLMFRKGVWTVALSSQNSDIPKDTQSKIRSDRQSRIGVWHEKLRLIIGGGHSLKDAPVPYANAVLDTGQFETCIFGRFEESMNYRNRLSCFQPRKVKSRVENSIPILTLVYGHGTVEFRIECIDEHEALIQADWHVLPIRSLCIELPVLMWLDSELYVDGKQADYLEYSEWNVQESVKVSNPLSDSQAEIRVPSDIPSRIHAPLTASHYFWHGFVADDPVKHPFSLALISSQLNNPEQTGSVNFSIHINR
ncbi:hypothetical protein ACFL6F_02780 [Planctomycetota bacterium]